MLHAAGKLTSIKVFAFILRKKHTNTHTDDSEGGTHEKRPWPQSLKPTYETVFALFPCWNRLSQLCARQSGLLWHFIISAPFYCEKPSKHNSWDTSSNMCLFTNCSELISFFSRVPYPVNQEGTKLNESAAEEASRESCRSYLCSKLVPIDCMKLWLTEHKFLVCSLKNLSKVVAKSNGLKQLALFSPQHSAAAPSTCCLCGADWLAQRW